MLQVPISLFCEEMLLVEDGIIITPEVKGWSEYWQQFAGFVVVVSGILLSLVFGVVSGSPKIGNDVC